MYGHRSVSVSHRLVGINHCIISRNLLRKLGPNCGISTSGISGELHKVPIAVSMRASLSIMSNKVLRMRKQWEAIKSPSKSACAFKTAWCVVRANYTIYAWMWYKSVIDSRACGFRLKILITFVIRRLGSVRIGPEVTFPSTLIQQKSVRLGSLLHLKKSFQF